MGVYCDRLDNIILEKIQKIRNNCKEWYIETATRFLIFRYLDRRCLLFVLHQTVTQTERLQVYDNGQTRIIFFNCLFDLQSINATWKEFPSHGLPAPECRETDWSRDNHLGNGKGGYANKYNWTVPDLDRENCVLRIRYTVPLLTGRLIILTYLLLFLCYARSEPHGNRLPLIKRHNEHRRQLPFEPIYQVLVMLILRVRST